MVEHKILILPSGREIVGVHGESLLNILAAHGCAIAAPCGGNGTCGKCKVRLLSGRVAGAVPDENGDVLACRAAVVEDLTLELNVDRQVGEDRTLRVPATGSGTGVGAALDIGTTTLALCTVDISTGTVLETCTALNPQGVLGADVLSRIRAWGDGKGTLLQRLLLDRVRTMLVNVGGAVRELTVAANTTMLHLLLGVDPTSLGTFPFLPQFTAMQVRSGVLLGLPAETVRLLPSADGYIGSDAVAGVLACGMDERKETCLLVDIGTNGEMILSHRGRLYAASAAAGPALEGACIECGMGGVRGAIDRVTANNGTLSIGTVGDATPRGICGSGLVDLIALLLRERLIDENGTWTHFSGSPLARFRVGDRFCVCEDVYLSQRDIRQYQLAKSAIASGIEILLSESGVRADEVARVYLAGGLGCCMSVVSAAQTGLLPRVLAERAEGVGNTALAGARLCLSDGACLTRAERIAEGIRTIELANLPSFGEAFIANMALVEL